jgi:SPP1 family predicted phage head-tail adaptor
VLETWASIEQVTARERFAAGSLQTDATHVVRIRYASALAAIDASWSVLFGARRFVLVLPPENAGERNREIVLTCREGARAE